jgi:hypothetical protein
VSVSFDPIENYEAVSHLPPPVLCGDPRFVKMSERSYNDLRKAGMPED